MSAKHPHEHPDTLPPDTLPPDTTPATTAPSDLPHALAHVLRLLSARRQGMSVVSLAMAAHMSRGGMGDRIRRLRAYGAVEPVPSPFSDAEQHWAITAHGRWMLAERIACCAASRPREAGPDIVPARSYCNASQRQPYIPTPDPGPARAGAMRAYQLPSLGVCGGGA